MSETNFNHETLKNIIQNILDEAKKQGATSAEVDVNTHKGFTVHARQREVESIEYHQDKIIDITVYIGKRTGAASLSDIRPEAIRSAVKAACNIARFTDEDPCSGLADKNLLAFNFQHLDINYPWNITVAEAVDMAVACETKALEMDKRIVNSEGSSVVTSHSWHAYGNSEGFIGIFPATRHEISAVLIAKQGDEMQRDYSYSVATDPHALEKIDVIAKKAVERTVRRLGAQQLKTCKAPVIYLSEEPARGLLGHFVSAIQGGNLYRKSSFLLNQLDKQIFPEHITMTENPHLPKGLGSAPFDNDGVATRSNIFIDKGVLRSYSLGVYSARKLGMQTTGNAGGVHNLSVTTGNKNFTELLKKMDTGLVITELMGNGVNLVTGDYSRGAAGYWVEKGEIKYPVEEITIASRLQDMYRNIVEIGSDIDRRGNILTGSILIEEMTIAGKD